MPYLGPGIDNGYRSRFIYTATAGQTSFSGGDSQGITLTYTDSEYLDVYQNGVLLVPGDDYAATTGTTVVLVQGASLNDKVEMIQYQAFGVADTVSRADGGAFGGNIGIGGTLSVTGNVISPITLGGATPTLTIGDAGAEDAKIVFDGNAQDYHIGLDDSIDSLTIGKGSTLGTTTSMVINANGVITKPLQPAFLVKVASTYDILAGGSANTTIPFATEIIDKGGDFASNTFTAPVSGSYQLQFLLRLTGIDTAANSYDFIIKTSNRSYIHRFDPDFADSDFAMMATLSVLADMDASDTASVEYYQDAGSAQTDVIVSSHFSGYLVA